MYTAINTRASIAIAFWSVYVSATPLVSGANLSGQWRLEAELIHHSGHKIIYLYDDLGNLVEYREEDITDPDPPIHFGGYGPVVHSDGKIEGTLTREVTCGEVPQVMCTGSVSEDNRVELTCTIPGASGFCDLDGSFHYWSQTDWVGSFEGIYDPTKRVITGTFEANQEQDSDEFWGYGYYYREERTHTLQSGTFTIRISGVNILDAPLTMVVYNPNTDSPEIPIRAVGHPSGGMYHWEILRGEDKIRFVEGIDNAEVKLQAVRPSERRGDTEIKVIYTVGSNAYVDTHSITIQKPSFLRILDIRLGPWWHWLFGYCVTYTFQVYDQLESPQPVNSQMPSKEYWKFICEEPKKYFEEQAFTLTKLTNKLGCFDDDLIITWGLFDNPPTNWIRKQQQKVWVAGWLVDERCQIYYIDDAISIPGKCGTCESNRSGTFRAKALIYPGETHSHIISVDSSTSGIAFGIVWRGSDLALVLYDPSGVEIEPNVAMDDPNIEYTDGSSYQCYTIQEPNIGNWTMEIRAIDVPEDGGDYIATAHLVTNQASFADFDSDGLVNLNDLAILAAHWKSQNCSELDSCSGADLNDDGRIDSIDLIIFADHWLEESP